MKYIISGTDRPDSNSMKVCKILQGLYSELGEETEIIDLRDIPLSQLDGSQYGKRDLPNFEKWVDKTLKADSMHVVIPEYNGSYPGVLKYFIDHWKYPDSFEFRPVSFVGLGGRFGGIRPVEHMQGVFGYRNSFIYPERVFLMNIWNILDGDKITDPMANELLEKQVKGFCDFVKGLHQVKLHANDRK